MKQDIPAKLAKAVAEVLFPVYGIVGEPQDLRYYGHLTISGNIPAISVSYTSPRYPPYPNDALAIRNFRIESVGSLVAIYPSKDLILQRMLEDQVRPVRNPFRWEGTLKIADVPFNGTLHYYASPLKISGFHLKSEKTVIKGQTYGPSCDELIELLEGLQVLNGHNDVIRQYDKPRDF